MKKSHLLIMAILLLTACAPKEAASSDQPPTQPIDITTIPSGDAFAGLIDPAPANVTWYAPDEIPFDSGITATIRDNDDGLRLVVDGVVMPVWNANGVWKMSDGFIADKDTNPVDFANGEIGAAGHKGGTTVFVRMNANGEWEVGLVE